jgi:hypothetical protein
MEKMKEYQKDTNTKLEEENQNYYNIKKWINKKIE